ncbi:MFS transporter [Ralstonia holmesii]|uniref:Niacin/nicotinamide transporter NaiP n=1 Tax=Ralstonia holmesii TaxID=3058602 RepID=A0ABC8QFS2_9RALS|nr:MFS transporter [Ralstonia sp. LMG 32967]CAJ0797003.1 Putative niacin/nicotinamide transporter NaiP [Ralstonia sp. LMG 32967]CAJ0806014.1 Putative niacin/nicotinamide transporter NaiP [Ralstonia sp. LMG 32967]
METTTHINKQRPSGPWSLAWYRELDIKGKKAFNASFGGWAIDAFDFMVFSFVITSLVNLWGIDRGKAGLLGTVTLLFSSIGGWIAGILADRYGRAKVLQGTIIWFSVCTVLIGFAQTFEQVFALRALQGLGFGGEWAVGAVLIGEIVTPKNRGKAVGVVQSGWAVGWGAAAILYSLAFSMLPETLAWRALFWVGIIPAFLVLYVRKHVSEPEVFVKTRAAQDAGMQKPSAWAIFSPSMLRTTVLAAILCTGMQGGYYAMSTWLPTFLKVERHLSVLNTSGYLLVIILGSFCGYIGGAYLSDYWGRRRNFIVFSALSVISIVLYLRLPLSDTQMLFLGFPLGFSACGIFSGIGAYLTELYPSANRANGQSFTYNFGRGIGALFPALVGHLSQSTNLATAIAVFAGTAYGAVFLMTLLLPETKGQALE